MAKKQKKQKKQKQRKRKLFADDIGLIHSGSSGNSDKQIDALKDAIKLFSNQVPGNAKFADDKHDKLNDHVKQAVKDGVKLLIAAGGTQSAKAAVDNGGGKPVVVTSVSSASVLPLTKVAGFCARTTELDPIRLELLHEMLPGVTKIGALHDPSRLDAEAQKIALENKRLALGIKEKLHYQPVDPNIAKSPDDQIDDAFDKWGTTDKVEAAIITADPVFNNHLKRVVKTSGSALRTIPAVYQWREFAEAGGLMSYGPNLTVAYKLAGYFVGRIAAGKDTVETLPLLPLEGFELVINLKTAEELKITVPPTLLARATDVILK